MSSSGCMLRLVHWWWTDKVEGQTDLEELNYYKKMVKEDMSYVFFQKLGYKRKKRYRSVVSWGGGGGEVFGIGTLVDVFQDVGKVPVFIDKLNIRREDGIEKLQSIKKERWCTVRSGRCLIWQARDEFENGIRRAKIFWDVREWGRGCGRGVGMLVQKLEKVPLRWRVHPN